MEETIELGQLVELLLKRKWIIILSIVLSMGISAVYTFYMLTPIYESSTTLMVNTSKGFDASDIAASFDLGSISASQKLVVTYGEIVKSRIVLEQVNAQLDLGTTYEKLIKQVKATPVSNTEILKITVSDEDPAKAARIANKISEVFIKEVIRILKVDNVEKIDIAIPIPEPINVKKALNLAIAFVLGAMIGVFIIFAIEMLDNTFRSAEEVEKHLGLTVIGVIPNFTDIKD